MNIFHRVSLGTCVAMLFGVASALAAQGGQAPVLHAKTYNSQFPKAAGLGESYNGIGESDDGIIYYAIDSRVYNIPGQIYALNPSTGQIAHVADLNTATRQGNIHAIAQGK